MPFSRTARALQSALIAAPLIFPASVLGDIVGATRVASVSQPIFATHAPGDPSRLFIATRPGQIQILDLETSSLLPTPFLSISGVDAAGEGGLLGLAFHPDYAENGKFYVNVTKDNGGQTFQGASSPFSTHITEYTRSQDDPNAASADSARTVLEIVQPQNNHNGGWIGFSPKDNYLYVATGDGGSGNDNGSGHTPSIGNAQDLYLEATRSAPAARNLLGKMLRLDVDGDDFPEEDNRNYAIPPENPLVGDVIYDDEIWSYGLRNPFRNSFDRLTGDLWIGDVGQGAREEIDFQPASSTGGENYGWRLREGDIATPSNGIGGSEPAGHVGPVYDYNHNNGDFGGFAVTGGVLYRGPDPDLRGQYLFGDYVTEHVWQFDPSDPDGTVANINSQIVPNAGSVDQVAAFAEDADGNVYIVDLGGQVFRIDTTIMLPGDVDASGAVDDEDYAVWQSHYGQTGALAADANGDGVVDAADYTVWRDNYGRALPDAAASAAPSPCAIGLLVGGAVALVCHRRRRLAP